MTIAAWTKKARFEIKRKNVDSAFAELKDAHKKKSKKDHDGFLEFLQQPEYRLPHLLEVHGVYFECDRFTLQINSGHAAKAYDALCNSEIVENKFGCLASYLWALSYSFVSSSDGIVVSALELDSISTLRDMLEGLQAIAPFISKGGYILVEDEFGGSIDIRFDGSRLSYTEEEGDYE